MRFEKIDIFNESSWDDQDLKINQMSYSPDCPNISQCRELIESLCMNPKISLYYASKMRSKIKVENKFLKEFYFNLRDYLSILNKSSRPLNIEDFEHDIGEISYKVTEDSYRYVVYGKHNIGDFQFSKYLSEVSKRDIGTVGNIVQKSHVFKCLMSPISVNARQQLIGIFYGRIITCVIICELSRIHYLLRIPERWNQPHIDQEFYLRAKKSDPTPNIDDLVDTQPQKKMSKRVGDQLFYQHKKLYQLLSPENIKIAQKNPDGDAFFGGIDPDHIDEIRRSHCKMDNYFYLKIFANIDNSPGPSLVMPIVFETQPQIAYIEI